MKKNQKKENQISYEKHEIFNIVTKDGKTFICVGNTIIYPQEFKTLDEAVRLIDSKPYDLIINATAFLVKQAQKLEKNENKENAINHENI